MRALETFQDATLSVVGHTGAGYETAANVTFYGAVSDRQKLEELYTGADFLVLPSLAEGMPTVILEAFAFGLPVIASDVGAVNTAVTDGETGFLVPAGNVARLAAALQRAQELPSMKYEQMRSSCLAQMAGCFSPERVRERLLAIVAEATANKAATDA